MIRTIQKDGSILDLEENNEELNNVFWHTSSHILAQAVKRLYPNTKLGIGPAIENGFYYDFKVEKPLTEEDINKDEPTTTPELTPQQPTTPTTPTTPENTYSDAGLVEDTIMIIAIAVLGITAVYAYKKVNQYQGI